MLIELLSIFATISSIAGLFILQQWLIGEEYVVG